IKWVVGNREKIQIYKDQWLHGGENEIPAELEAALFSNLFVLAAQERMRIYGSDWKLYAKGNGQRESQQSGSSLSFDTQHKLITKLWKLKLPPKLKDILVESSP
ncbi:hypothetical protein HID58_033903, partial [Brassica napus]